MAVARCWRSTRRPATASAAARRGFPSSTTGRPRRVGWFDAVPLRYAVAVNSVSAIMLNKLDILAGLDEILMCVAYEIDGQRVETWPSSAEVLGRARPPGLQPRTDLRPSFRQSPAGRDRIGLACFRFVTGQPTAAEPGMAPARPSPEDCGAAAQRPALLMSLFTSAALRGCVSPDGSELHPLRHQSS